MIALLIILLLVSLVLICLQISKNRIDNYLKPITEDTCWTYWEPSPPELVKKCYKNWSTIGELKDVRILNKENISDYIPKSEWKEICDSSENSAVKSDFIAMYLLHNYGGTWLDGSIFMRKPLFSWLPRTENFFAFRADRFSEHTICPETFFMWSPKGHPFPKMWYDKLHEIANGEGKKLFIARAKREYPNISKNMQEEYLWVYIVGKYLLLENPYLLNEITTLPAEKGPWAESEKYGWDNVKTICKKMKEEGTEPITKLHNILRKNCGPNVIPLN
jgi:hypothetical protein